MIRWIVGSNRLLKVLSFTLALMLMLPGCGRQSANVSPETSVSQGAQETVEEESSVPQEKPQSSSQADSPSASSSSSAQSPTADQEAGQSSANGSGASSGMTSPAPVASAAYKDVTYDKKGSYTSTEFFNNAVIKARGIVIENKTFYGDVTIEASDGSGSITLKNVAVKGTLTVEGESDILKLEDCQINEIILDNEDVEVYAAGKTDVISVLVKNDASLEGSDLKQGSDGFENIVISGSGDQLSLSINGMTVDVIETRSGAWITVNKDARVKSIVAKAPTYVRGSGTVDQLTASNYYVYYEYPPDELTSTGNYSLPRKHNSNDNYWDGYSEDRPDVHIAAISNCTLWEGQTDEISVDTNADTLTAASSDTAVAAVSVNSAGNLVIQANKAGTAEITVNGKRSGYRSSTITFMVTVQSRGNAPVIVNIAGVPDSWQNTNAVISFQVSDGDDNLQSVTINGMAVSAAGGVYSFTAEENGDYLISAADKNGNVTNQTVTVDKIDKTKPVIGTIQVSNPDVMELEKTLTFTVTDAGGAGVREVTVNDVPVSAVNGVYSHLITANGSYTIRAVDNAGNEAAPSQVTVSNIQVPQLTFISQTPDAGTPTNQDVVVRFSVKDLGSRTLAVSPSGTITAVDEAKGIYQFSVSANGEYTVTAGSEAAPLKVTVSNIDKTKPVIDGVQVSNPDVMELEKTLTFTVTDAGGAGVREVTVNDVPVSAVNGVYSHLITANGSYTIRAVDNAGNEAAPSQVTVSNIQVPQLTFISQTPDAGTPTNQDVVVRFSVKDLGSRTLAVSPSGTITAVDEAKGIYQFSVSANGEYTVTAGSEATPLKVTVANIDKEPPTYRERR